MNKVRVTDLSAFGLRRAPNTINLNTQKLIDNIRSNPPSNVVDEVDELIRDITNKNFDVTLMGLEGIDKPTQFAEEAITNALSSQSGITGSVDFKHSVVN